jgi:hypothetical protein
MNRSCLVDIASTHARKEEASCSTSSATSFCELGVPIAHRMCLWVTGGSKEPVSVVVDVDAAFAATNDRPCPKGGLYLSRFPASERRRDLADTVLATTGER